MRSHEKPSSGDLLRPREVAILFGVRPATIARWAREGKLMPLRTPGGHRRYSEEEVKERLAESTAPDLSREQMAEDATRLYDQGWSIRQVAEKFNTSYGVMRSLLRKRVRSRERGGTSR